MPRFRVRSLMIVVALVAFLFASTPRVWRSYQCWSFHRSQAVKHGRLEQQQRLRENQERTLSTDRAAIRAQLMKTTGFAAKDSAEQDKLIFARVFHHRVQSKLARLEAEKSAETRRDHEAAAGRCSNPFASDVP